ncbi:MAG: hypothetical protein JNG86_10990, partial [Verrucomicrobiaceae bacterium]|nr:hypothetical protein [Verrucomicrobiaceae bacterium]
MPAVTFVIHSPAPYHVELFDALAARPGMQITVIYVHAHEHGRQWTEPRFAHRALFLKDTDSARTAVQECELLVMGFHEHPASRQWMRLRLASGKKWAFWGENPGAHLRGRLGRWLRRWRLRWLRASAAPVWAIGTRAVDAYRAEIGGAREV